MPLFLTEKVSEISNLTKKHEEFIHETNKLRDESAKSDDVEGEGYWFSKKHRTQKAKTAPAGLAG